MHAVSAFHLLPICLVAALTGCVPEPADTEAAGFVMLERTSAATPLRLVLSGVSSNALGADGDASSLSAARLEIRPRTSGTGLLIYHDITEMVVEDAVIALSMGGGSGAALSRVLDAVKHPFESGSSDPSPLTASGGHGFTGRVLFEGLEIQIVESAGEALLLSARRARLNFGPDTLVLDGSIVMATPRGEELRSTRAAFSDGFEGIHLPDGYEIGGRRFEAGAIVIDAVGALTPATRIPDVRYDDPISRTERVVLEYFSERAPAELQPLILAVLAHLGPGGFREPLR